MADPLDPPPNLDDACFRSIDQKTLFDAPRENHAPRILLLYGSLRKRSFSRLVSEKAARILHRIGAETRTFCPSGLPLPDDSEADHAKVAELRELVDRYSERKESAEALSKRVNQRSI